MVCDPLAVGSSARCSTCGMGELASPARSATAASTAAASTAEQYRFGELQRFWQRKSARPLPEVPPFPFCGSRCADADRDSIATDASSHDAVTTVSRYRVQLSRIDPEPKGRDAPVGSAAKPLLPCATRCEEAATRRHAVAGAVAGEIGCSLGESRANRRWSRSCRGGSSGEESARRVCKLGPGSQLLLEAETELQVGAAAAGIETEAATTWSGLPTQAPPCSQRCESTYGQAAPNEKAEGDDDGQGAPDHHQGSSEQQHCQGASYEEAEACDHGQGAPDEEAKGDDQPQCGYSSVVPLCKDAEPRDDACTHRCAPRAFAEPSVANAETFGTPSPVVVRSLDHGHVALKWSDLLHEDGFASSDEELMGMLAEADCDGEGEAKSVNETGEAVADTMMKTAAQNLDKRGTIRATWQLAVMELLWRFRANAPFDQFGSTALRIASACRRLWSPSRVAAFPRCDVQRLPLYLLCLVQLSRERACEVMIGDRGGGFGEDGGVQPSELCSASTGGYLDLESRRAARCASKLHAGLDVDVSSLEKTAENVKPALAIPAEEAKPPAKVRGPRGGRRRRQQQYRA